eukprot:TRINITY_DN74107_c0_g1_i1.p1 TRINITY_DN74107_c0_g1~~TRINITY_DN74107_c0_g1_i1.p1  ORF type:complete len:548 (-),score=98.16 TRINITY_DN74107_c0_g1_i1:232-1641(-)
MADDALRGFREGAHEVDCHSWNEDKCGGAPRTRCSSRASTRAPSSGAASGTSTRQTSPRRLSRQTTPRSGVCVPALGLPPAPPCRRGHVLGAGWRPATAGDGGFASALARASASAVRAACRTSAGGDSMASEVGGSVAAPCGNAPSASSKGPAALPPQLPQHWRRPQSGSKSEPRRPSSSYATTGGQGTSSRRPASRQPRKPAESQDEPNEEQMVLARSLAKTCAAMGNSRKKEGKNGWGSPECIAEVMCRLGLQKWQKRSSRPEDDDGSALDEDEAVIRGLQKLKQLRQGKLVSPLAALAGEVFSAYDADGDGRLNVGELGALLRDHGVDINYSKAEEAIRMAVEIDGVGAGSEGSVPSIGREEFARLVVSGTEQYRGYSEGARIVLRSIFDVYADAFGHLTPVRCADLLAAAGRAPKSKKESQELGHVIASCRGDQRPGPLNFDEFLTLSFRLNLEEAAENLLRRRR